MRMRSAFWAVAVSILVTTPIWAQTPAAQSDVPLTLHFQSGPPFGSNYGAVLVRNAVKGKPYSLTETTTEVTILSDGSTKTSVLVKHQMRDADGRERWEIGDTGVFFSLTDPVAYFLATVLPINKSAIVTQFPAPKLPTAEEEAKAAELRAKQAAYRKEHPSPDIEELPGKMVAGVYAVGERQTQIIQGVQVVTERWTSPDLKIVLKSTSNDPRPQMGKITTVVTDLKIGAPDPALFVIPDGYTVQVKHP
jgi:hypothetical protein